MPKVLLLLCNLLFFFQSKLPAQQALLLEDVFRQLREKHPAGVQANLLPEAARAELTKARGGFDLKTFGDYESKIFQNKNYYAVGEYGLKLPTWYGLELKTGFNTATGNFLNPANALPVAGQAIAGFDWAVGRGLFIDDRRAELLQAQKGIQLAENERLILLNDLFFTSAKIYWSWATAREQASVLEASVARAIERFEGIKENFRQGDKPAIDTLEAYILVQTRQFEWQEKLLEARELAIILNNFLWETPPNPANFQDVMTPARVVILEKNMLEEKMLREYNLTLQQSHPALRASFLKLDILDIERRLKNENRKPQLDLSYNFLATGWTFFPENENIGGLLGNNIKFGIQFSYPLQNRKARGDFQKTKIKIASVAAELEQKQRDLENKLRQYANELNTLANQIERYEAITENYRKMLQAEQEKFLVGESTVFLLNSREQKLLDAELKLTKLFGDFQKAKVAVDWALGILK